MRLRETQDATCLACARRLPIGVSLDSLPEALIDPVPESLGTLPAALLEPLALGSESVPLVGDPLPESLGTLPAALLDPLAPDSGGSMPLEGDPLPESLGTLPAALIDPLAPDSGAPEGNATALLVIACERCAPDADFEWCQFPHSPSPGPPDGCGCAPLAKECGCMPWECHCPSSKLEELCAGALLMLGAGPNPPLASPDAETFVLGTPLLTFRAKN